jgi:hypothetical protein
MQERRTELKCDLLLNESIFCLFRDYVVEEDFMKASRKISESKKLESGSKDYSKM